MATDLERFVELYKSVGIDLEPESLNEELILRLQVDHHEKIQGYSRFYTEICFDKEGKFKEQMIAE